MAIVTLTILLSYLVEGREVVQVDANVVFLLLRDFILCPPTPHIATSPPQSTILDTAFSFVAAALLITAGGGCAITIVHEKYCRKSFIQTMTIFVTITLLNSNVFPFYDRRKGEALFCKDL